MSILEARLNKDKTAKEEAVKKVASLNSIRATDVEQQYTKKLISDTSKEFSTLIAQHGLSDEIKKQINEFVHTSITAFPLSYEEKSRIERLVITSMFGLGPLEQYMTEDSKVTDIVVLKYNHICIEDDTGVHKIDAEFNSEEHLVNVIQRIVQKAGRQINLATPAVDAKLDDGSRIHATIPPITPDGATLTIRRFNNTKLDAEDYVKLQSLNQPMLDFLRIAVQAKLNIIVTGGTGSGKTTLLNMLSSFIPEDELIITIEDSCELQLRQPNVRRMETRLSQTEQLNIGIQELVKHSLRMRPDRIIVGEVRDGTVVDMLSAMSTGHEGSMSTIHTDSPRALVDSRLPTLFSQYKGGTFTKETQALMTAEAVQLIVQISREPNYKRKITHITAVTGFNTDNNTVSLMDIFQYDRKKDAFTQINDVPENIVKRIEYRGKTIPSSIKTKR